MQSGASSSADAVCARLALVDWHPLRNDDPIAALRNVEFEVDDAEHTYQRKYADYEKLTTEFHARKKQHEEARRNASLNPYGSSLLIATQQQHFATTWVPSKPRKPEPVNSHQLVLIVCMAGRPVFHNVACVVHVIDIATCIYVPLVRKNV